MGQEKFGLKPATLATPTARPGLELTLGGCPIYSPAAGLTLLMDTLYRLYTICYDYKRACLIPYAAVKGLFGHACLQKIAQKMSGM